jgi:hypothetical protein
MVILIFFVKGQGLEDIIIAVSRNRNAKAVSKIINKLIKKGKIKKCESKDFVGVIIDDVFYFLLFRLVLLAGMFCEHLFTITCRLFFGKKRFEGI